MVALAWLETQSDACAVSLCVQAMGDIALRRVFSYEVVLAHTIGVAIITGTLKRMIRNSRC